MKTYKLKDFKRGWIIGDFDPSIIKTKDFEVTIKKFKKGDVEDAHVHKVADEIGVVVKGSCQVNGTVYHEEDIIWAEPNDTISFEAIEDCVMAVVKIPSVIGDKYEVDS